jgi:hypothetical protein
VSDSYGFIQAMNVLEKTIPRQKGELAFLTGGPKTWSKLNNPSFTDSIKIFRNGQLYYQDLFITTYLTIHYSCIRCVCMRNYPAITPHFPYSSLEFSAFVANIGVKLLNK